MASTRATRLAVVLSLLLPSFASAEQPTDRLGDPEPEGAIVRLGTVRFRHGANVVSVAVSPDSKTLASTGEDAAVRVWDVVSGKQLWTFDTKGRKAGPIQFSPDGSVVVAVIGRSLERWDARSGRPLGRLARHPSGITDFRFSPTGKLIATVSYGFLCPVEVSVTEVASARELLRLSPDPDKFSIADGPRVAFSPDERLLLVNSGDETIEAWRFAGRSLAYTLKSDGWIGANWQVAPDGVSLIARTGTDRNAIIVWDLATGKERYSLPAASRRTFHATPGGKTLLLTGSEERTDEYDLATGKRIRALSDAGLDFLGISPDGQILAYADGNRDGATQPRSVRLRKFPSEDKLRDFPAPELFSGDNRSCRCAFSPDGRTMALIRDGETTWGCSTGDDGVWFGVSWTASLELRALPGGKVLLRREYPRGNGWPLHSKIELLFSPDGRKAVTSGPWAALRVWQTGTGAEVTGHAGHDGAVRSGFFSPDGATFTSLDATDSILTWDPTTGRTIRELPRTGLDVKAMTMSPDGRYLATLEELDHWVEVVSLWEAATGKPVARLARKFEHGHQPSAYPSLEAVGFAPDDTLLVAG